MGSSHKPPVWYDLVRYRIIPPIFLVVFTGAPQYLVLVGRGETPTWEAAARASLGNCFSWTCMGAFWVWAMIWLQVPSKQNFGPVTLFGHKPQYQDNGVLYYCVTVLAFFVVQALIPDFSTRVFANMPELMGCCNMAAIIFCTCLWIKGKLWLDHVGDRQESKPVLYEFYRGMELHPRVLGMDIKQLTNCRIGLMAWQVLILVFYFAGVERHGFNAATLVNLLLQSVYLAKFFWWETGYFDSLDIILDRAGYYICWGCLVWVPCFYTFSSYYLVMHLPLISTTTSIVVGVVGLLAIVLNYRVDVEKQLFRADHKYTLWGKPARFLKTRYRDATGTIKESRLLLSGCWGVARHLNYLFELMAALAWSAPGVGLSIWPFSYFIFLVGLLVHRNFRDEEKCAAKYGDDWDKYCQMVPYRIIPYVF